MPIAKRDTPSGFAIFGEEIRPELGNKFSLMGVVMGAWGFPSFPVQLRLAVVVNYYEHVGESEEPVVVFLKVSGEPAPAAAYPIDLKQLRSPRKPEDMDPEDPLVGISLAFGVAPLVMERPGVIEVTAVRGDTEIKLGRLPVIQAVQDSIGSPLEL